MSAKDHEQTFKESLVQLKVDMNGWKVLWRDTQTDQYWREWFPHSEMHGGGPSAFLQLTEDEAKNEFGSW